MATLVEHRMVQPMIVVAPTAAVSFTSDSECLDAVGGPQFETYLTADVVGWVDRRYRTVRQAGARAVGGMSSGGYCALNRIRSGPMIDRHAGTDKFATPRPGGSLGLVAGRVDALLDAYIP